MIQGDLSTNPKPGVTQTRLLCKADDYRKLDTIADMVAAGNLSQVRVEKAFPLVRACVQSGNDTWQLERPSALPRTAKLIRWLLVVVSSKAVPRQARRAQCRPRIHHLLAHRWVRGLFIHSPTSVMPSTKWRKVRDS
jgi:hypothetical protein